MMYYYTCPRFLEARREELQSARFQSKMEPYRDMMAVMSYYTGRNLTTPEDVFYIDNLFQAEVSIVDLSDADHATSVTGVDDVAFERQIATHLCLLLA